MGLHAHTGSGILTPEVWQETALFLTGFLEDFPQVRYLNLGGGLGIPEQPQQEGLDLSLLDAELAQVKQGFPGVEFWLEPARFLVTQADVLLAPITQVKTKNEETFIGIATGMNSLIRPAPHGSYHFAANLTRLHELKTRLANIVGPICESGDTLAFSRLLPETIGGKFLIAPFRPYQNEIMS